MSDIEMRNTGLCTIGIFLVLMIYGCMPTIVFYNYVSNIGTGFGHYSCNNFYVMIGESDVLKMEKWAENNLQESKGLENVHVVITGWKKVML